MKKDSMCYLLHKVHCGQVILAGRLYVDKADEKTTIKILMADVAAVKTCLRIALPCLDFDDEEDYQAELILL